MKTLLISACLLGVRCKYTGGDNLDPAAAALCAQYHLIPVCPEQLGGLSTPRPPAERQGDRVVTKDGTDVTAQYQKGAEETVRLAERFSCEGAVLKARSPACGCGEIYDGTFSGRTVRGSGVAAEALLSHGFRVMTNEQSHGQWPVGSDL